MAGGVIADEVSRQRQNEHHGELRDRKRRIARHIGDGDAVRPGCLDVDVVPAGRRNRDQLQLFAFRDEGRVKYHLVGDGDRDVVKALLAFLRAGQGIGGELSVRGEYFKSRSP
jgi:hypothetical protein